MWDTSSGPFTATPKERALLEEAVGFLYNRYGLPAAAGDDEIEDWDTGVLVFDRIALEDRPYVLLHVAESLLRDGPPPPRRAWNEGALLAVYRTIEDSLEMELEDERHPDLAASKEDRTYWRRLVREAWMEACYRPDVGEGSADDAAEDEPAGMYQPGEGPFQPVESLNAGEWDFKLECLSARTLEDHDCELEEILGKGLQQVEYFAATPPCFSDDEKRRLERFYFTLTGVKPGETEPPAL